MEVVTRESSPSSLVLRKTGIFCSIGNIILYESIKVGLPIEQNPPGERTAAEWNCVAGATRRRRRILFHRILI